jgi:nucleoside-diphosphate-sugar epimerase
MKNGRHILLTGGCGYVGSVLVPKLVRRYPVTVVDSLIFGNHLEPAAGLTVVPGDIRDTGLMRSLLPGVTDVIHLASIANDPCSDLDQAITLQVNRDAMASLVGLAKELGAGRFINASSSSVYGVKEEESVTEDLPLEPITLYARTKAEGEEIVADAASSDFVTVSVRLATVCGVSPRMRFDVIVNIMTKTAIVNRLITVHGGDQYRPNVHIDDITDLYLALVEQPGEKINGKVFNFGSTNHTVAEIARMVHEETGAPVRTDAAVTDSRSYRISSEKIKAEMGIVPVKTIRQAIDDIRRAFDAGYFAQPESSIYYNIRTMKEHLKAIRAGG